MRALFSDGADRCRDSEKHGTVDYKLGIVLDHPVTQGRVGNYAFLSSKIVGGKIPLKVSGVYDLDFHLLGEEEVKDYRVCRNGSEGCI